MADTGQVLIKDLPEATSVSDSSYIPVDNGTLTQKITVENYNASSNVTAKAYAEAAAASAGTAQDAIADVNAKVDAAQAQANIATTQAGYAQTYAGNAQTYAGNAQGYANSAQGSATNAAASANAASSSADAANDNAILSRSWAEGNTGARQGENTNNARYWASKAETAAQLTIDDHLDPNSTNPVENRVIYNAMQDIHATGSNIYIKTNEQTLRGKDCNISDGTTTLTAAFDQTGKATFEGVVLTGSLAITATDGTRSLTDYLTVPYFGNYTKNVAFWSATITVTTTTSEFNRLTVSAKKNGAVMGSGTFSSGSASIIVPETGTYTLEVTLDWKTYTSSVTVSDTTASGTIAGFIAPISLTTTTTDFYGESISVTLDGDPITTTLAFDNTGAASFDALQAGVYVFTVTYGGEPYTSTVTVSAETSYNAPEIKMWTATINITGASQLQLQPITVYKDGVQVQTQLSFNAAGTASYIAHESGSYVFKSEYDSYAYSSEAVSVVAETTYSASIDVFICTLSISTTSSELFSQTITVTKGVSTVGTTAFSAQGAATFRVHETGTYTLTCTYGGEDYSESITIVAGDDGQTKSVTIDTIPDGSTVTPTDDIQTWLECAGIRDKSSYTTLSDVLADHDTLYRLMASDNAVDYLVRSTTWVSGITSDEYAMKYIGKWNYCSDTLLDDSTWLTAICGSAYMKSVLNTEVPQMTSDTQPGGEAFATNESATSSEKAWRIFDRNTSSSALKNSSTVGGSIGYCFPNATEVKYVLYGTTVSSSSQRTLTVQYSDDGSTYQNAKTVTDTYTPTYHETPIEIPEDIGSHRYWQVEITVPDGAYINYGYELQFYGRTDVTENLIDIYSAASDTVSISGNGISLVVETDPTGHGTIAKSSLPNGTYTFTSLVAKDLPNGSTSNAYSKQIVISDTSIVEGVYVMPDGYVAYWYGYGYDNIEASHYSTANGTIARANPSKTKNQISISSTLTKGSSYTAGGIYDFVNLDPTNYTRAVCHMVSVSVARSDYGGIQLIAYKKPTSGYAISLEDKISIAMYGTLSNVIKDVSLSSYQPSVIDGIGFTMFAESGNASCTFDALWLE